MKRAFTLLEVNIAVMVMAFGVLGLISLYSLGFRESQQSREDVEAAVLADRNMNALVTMLSDTNMTWSAWNKIGKLPAGGETSAGWLSYFDADRDDNDSTGGRGYTGSTNPKAQEVFNAVKSACSGCEGADVSFDPGHLQCGLVVYQDGGRCGISFRAGRRAGTMINQPLYYTEVFFQGDPSK